MTQQRACRAVATLALDEQERRSRRPLLDEASLSSDRLEMNRLPACDETEQPRTTSETAQEAEPRRAWIAFAGPGV
jgi:hypothetical protein